MTDTISTIIYVYLTLACLSCVLSPGQVVAVLEAGKKDEHYAYGYMLLWLVYTVTLAGVLTFLVQKVSARD